MAIIDLLAEPLGRRLTGEGFVFSGAYSETSIRRFTSGKLELSLTWDARNGEANLSLRILPNGQPIGFWMLGELLGDRQSALTDAVGVTTPEKAAEAATQILDCIERYLPKLLHWDDEASDQLLRLDSEMREEAWRRQRLLEAKFAPRKA